ncbi:MAG: alpha-1,2-fucosyltransferase [Lachnospiraceae bacterium]|nr:alpha-1,2-fucosyltransferase [Lachnospiraceae bacterium]
MIIVKIWEGLGNQMFQYAFARTLKELGQEVYISSDKIENSLIPVKVNRKYALNAFCISIPNKNLKKSFKWRFIERSNLLQRLIFKVAQKKIFPIHVIEDIKSPYQFHAEFLNPYRNTCFIGFFQNYKYFNKIRTILISEFSLKQKYDIPKELEEILQNEQTVAIHIRRGDYVKNRFAIDNTQYYQKAMQYIEKNIHQPTYIIFSDDIEWVKKNLQLCNKKIYVDRSMKLKEYEELNLMSRCKHNIIANSTFSWWGAWLNQNTDKIVVAPRIWLGSKSKGFIVPEEWHCI